MGYSTSGGCSRCTVQCQASPHSDLVKQARGALAQAVCSQSSNIFCSQQKSTSTVAEGIHGHSSGSRVPTAQLPAAQIGIAKVSCHLPINPTSKENIRAYSHARPWFQSPREMTCPPREAEENMKSLDTQKPQFGSGLLHKQAAFMLTWDILF